MARTHELASVSPPYKRVPNISQYRFSKLIGKGPQTFSTVFTHIAGDFGLVAQNPLTENGLLFTILSSSAVPVWDLIKTRIIKLF